MRDSRAHRAGLVAALLSAVVASACATTTPRIPAVVEGVAIPVREGYVTAADGARLFYRVVGNGPDTIVAVHGGPGLHSGALVSFEPLAAGGTVIFYDQRGGGRSSLPQDSSQVTAALHVSDLDALLRHFAIQRATLLGHSWGALLVVLYAIDHPERVGRMILVSPMPPRAQPYLSAYATAVAGMLGADTARFMRLSRAWDTTTSPHATCREAVPMMMRAGGARDPAAMDRVRDGLCTTAVHAEALRRGWTVTPQWTLQSLGMWDLRERLRLLQVETLVIRGERDPLPIAATQEWVTAIPRAGLAVFAGVGHYVYAEDPAAFARSVRQFLGRE